MCESNINTNVPNKQNFFSFVVTIYLLLFTDAAGEDQAFSSPFGCCIQEVLLCCHPTLSEEAIAARLSLTQRLENPVRILSSAADVIGLLLSA